MEERGKREAKTRNRKKKKKIKSGVVSKAIPSPTEKCNMTCVPKLGDVINLLLFRRGDLGARWNTIQTVI